MLTGELVEVAVHGLRMAADCFQLDGQVLDAELGSDPLSNRVKQIAGERLVVSVDLHMCRHHDEARFDRPDVQVVDILHAGYGFDGGCDLRRTDPGWS